MIIIIRPNKIILLIGASGSGKSTIGKKLEDRFTPQLISYTTRPMRKEEEDSRDYYFMNKDSSVILNGLEKVEKTTYDGHEYGLFKFEVDDRLAQGDTYFVCNKDGAEQIINIYGNDVIPFWIKIDEKTMRERMQKRGDSGKNIESRIEHAKVMKELEAPDFNHFELDSNSDIMEQLSIILNTVSHEKGKKQQ